MAWYKNGSTRKVTAKFTTNKLPAIPPPLPRPQKYTDMYTAPFLNPAFKWCSYRQAQVQEFRLRCRSLSAYR